MPFGIRFCRSVVSVSTVLVGERRIQVWRLLLSLCSRSSVVAFAGRFGDSSGLGLRARQKTDRTKDTPSNTGQKSAQSMRQGLAICLVSKEGRYLRRPFALRPSWSWLRQRKSSTDDTLSVPATVSPCRPDDREKRITTQTNQFLSEGDSA